MSQPDGTIRGAAAVCPFRAALVMLSLHVIVPAVLAGQEMSPPTPACSGETVASIQIRREPPRVLGRSVPTWARPVLSVLVQHRTTTADAIRPFLLLREGEPCTEHRRAESERLLRAQPYLAAATVVVLPDAAGMVRVEVSTVDEIPLVLGASIRGGRLSGVTYGSSNVLGAGIAASASWRDGLAYRDRLALRVRHYHIFGTPSRLALRLERDPLGRDQELVVERPYLTPLQRFGWYTGARAHDGYVAFFRGAEEPLSLAVARRRADVGAVFRLGSSDAGLFAGPYASREHVTPGHTVVVTDTGLANDADSTLAARFDPVRSTRLGGVAGLRWLSHTEARGFDALLGAQDIARGIQIAVGLGSAFENGGRGLFAATDIYLGAGTDESFTAVRVIWEGVQPEGAVTPHDVVASGRMAWYRKAGPYRTWITSAEFAGSWRVRIPHQLALDDRAGLRGYRGARIAGARRAVLRTEQRVVLMRNSPKMALGVAAFGEVGQTWRGDVPFGVTSGIRPSGGAGLLLAVPRESRRLLRIDIATPLSPDRFTAGYEISLTTSTPFPAFWRDSPVIAGIRAVTPPSALFGWP